MNHFLKSIIFLTSLFLIGSCSKTEQITITPTKEISYGVSLTEGRFVFIDETTFEDYVLQLNSESLDEWEKSIGFYSLRSFINDKNKGISEELQSFTEFPTESMRFCGILNSNNIVQVGDWIFKLNFDKREVWVISEQDKFLTEALITNIYSKEKMLVFSFEDDIFDMLDTENIEKARCKEYCASSTQDVVPDDDNYWYCDASGDEYGAELKSDLDNFGIWKHLYTKFKHRKKGALNASDEYVLFDIYFDYYWKKKCKKVTDSGTEYIQLNLFGNLSQPSSGRTYRKDHYEGTRCLSKYSLQSSVTFIEALDCGGSLHTLNTNKIDNL
jgi:hypothetical protein